jgi:hypothetical protein
MAHVLRLGGVGLASFHGQPGFNLRPTGKIEHYCKLGDRVIDQARRRVLEGEQVPNAEKIFSIFEAHTDLIKRGKVQTPLEFGHKVFLAESAQGLMNGKTSEMWSCHQSTPFHRVL